MLHRRLLSAAVGIPLVLLLIVVGGPAYDLGLAAILFLAVAELQLQAGSPAVGAPVWLAAAATAAMSLTPPAGRLGLLGLLVTGLVLSALSAIAARRGAKLGPWPLAIVLIAYAGWLGQYLHLLRHLAQGVAWVLLAVFVTFASDAGAYFVGRAFGRHRLAPRISPGKTIEGAAGGLAAAAAAAAVLGSALRLPLSLPLALSVGIGLSLAGQAGDLAESLLKRSLDVKDAGTLVPGHGGLLDRLDSLLFAGALLYYIAR